MGLLIKPLIDTSWDLTFSGFSLIDFFSIVFLVFAYCLIIKHQLYKKINKYLTVTWFGAHFGLIFLIFSYPLEGLEGILKMFFFPIAMLLFPFYIKEIKYRNKLFRFLLAGALFSALISVLQGFGFIPYETIRYTKELERANGFYHDIVTSRIYVVQGLLALYFIFKLKLFKLNKLVFIGLLFTLMLGGYFLYSKALLVIIFTGLALFFLTEEKKSSSVSLLLFIIPVLFIFSNNIKNSATQMFQTELDYNSGDLDDENRLLSGRGSIWEVYLENLKQANVLTQLIGMNSNDGRTHNEFLRILILSGVIGLFSYILFVFRLIGLSLKSLGRKKKFRFVTLWCFSMLIIDAFGIPWGLYPHYLILIFGFLILSTMNYKKYTPKVKPKIKTLDAM